MDGPRVGQDAMKNCTDQEYWDTLVSQCIPCSLACRQSLARKCDAVCESMDCNKRPGFYYDDLVKNCIQCSSVCGQHPRECALSCEPTAGPAALEQKACAEQEPWLALYLLLGLCLCSLVCSLLLGWTHLRRKGEASAASCHCREDPAKDGLVEAGSVGDGFTSIRIPEPVETCGFCFPGHGSAVQETKSCHSSSCHPGERAAPSFSGICSTGSAGALPSPEDGHFKIICSPAQEKAPMV
ncbi:tumor necrosis factor receptor superfamily member 13B [Onychostruthus taczanowskii]|uniref:tumor necrosis factor receptor superfamily member 13B n=1 Tax=Onychostruthus taczanowskii TaxID=356909 RepID=UPI001B801622|nr:tumor necrosis factor receptor superfamily member 13B [Onychostruthus taczanowskii]